MTTTVASSSSVTLNSISDLLSMYAGQLGVMLPSRLFMFGESSFTMLKNDPANDAASIELEIGGVLECELAVKLT